MKLYTLLNSERILWQEYKDILTKSKCFDKKIIMIYNNFRVFHSLTFWRNCHEHDNPRQENCYSYERAAVRKWQRYWTVPVALRRNQVERSFWIRAQGSQREILGNGPKIERIYPLR